MGEIRDCADGKRGADQYDGDGKEYGSFRRDDGIQDENDPRQIDQRQDQEHAGPDHAGQPREQARDREDRQGVFRQKPARERQKIHPYDDGKTAMYDHKLAAGILSIAKYLDENAQRENDGHEVNEDPGKQDRNIACQHVTQTPHGAPEDILSGTGIPAHRDHGIPEMPAQDDARNVRDREEGDERNRGCERKRDTQVRRKLFQRFGENVCLGPEYDFCGPCPGIGHDTDDGDQEELYHHRDPDHLQDPPQPVSLPGQ